MTHRLDPPLILDANDKTTIAPHIRNWQCFTRDMVTPLQVEEWIFAQADKEIENLYDLTETGADEDVTRADRQARIDKYSSVERLVILWNHYCVKSGRKSFSRGDVKRWFDAVVE